MKSQSRQARFDEAIALVEEAKETMAELESELESWLDGMPENLRGGSKADQLESAISDLQSIAAALDEAAATNVEFPGMCG